MATKEPQPQVVEVDQEDEIEQELVSAEYKTWKKNCLFLYDCILTYSLDWPSLTAQWLPVVTKPEGKDYSVYRIILGTHTNGCQQDHLIIASVRLPNDDIHFDESQYDSDRGEFGGYGSVVGGKIEIDVKINHQGEINRARYAPQNPYVIATKSPSSDVFIFDFTKHSSTPDPKGECKPELILKGHSKEGFGLSWSPFMSGHLLSAGYDHSICYWDISSSTYESSVVEALNIFNGHSDKVGDVAWHELHKNIFGSVSDDKTMKLWDNRVNPQSNSILTLEGHKREVNCLAFNHFNPFIVATGSSDETTGLWDLRFPSSMFHSIKSGEVLQVQWSSHYETVLASSGTGNRVNFYNISQIDDDISQEESKFGPPELMFTHAGHKSAVSDFSWNLNEPLLACSVSEDNSLHIWQPTLDIPYQ